MTEPSPYLRNLQYTGPWIPLQQMPLELKRPDARTRPPRPAAIPGKDVAALLNGAFAAYGPDGDKAIAASTRNWLGIDVFALQWDGAWRYHPGAQRLLRVNDADLRGRCGGRRYATAPADVTFIYVADFSRTAPTDCDERSRAAGSHAGVIARHIQLHCPPLGVTATQHRLEDGRDLALRLGLLESQRIALVQSLRREGEAVAGRTAAGEQSFRYGI